jgi:hypothetical protein
MSTTTLLHTSREDKRNKPSFLYKIFKQISFTLHIHFFTLETINNHFYIIESL